MGTRFLVTPDGMGHPTQSKQTETRTPSETNSTELKAATVTRTGGVAKRLIG